MKYKLKAGIEILPFDINSKKKSYILSISNRQFKISESLYQIISLIDGQSDTNEIAYKCSQMTGNKVSGEEIDRIIQDFSDTKRNH